MDRCCPAQGPPFAIIPRTLIQEGRTISIHFVEQGNGRPLLLVHGFPLDHTMWKHQIDRFSRSARVIAPDLRGFGKSEVSEGTVTMERFADDLAEVLDQIGVREPVVFCGLSMGGYIAWQFWRRHAAKLAAMILCDTRAAADNAETAAGRLKSAEQVEQEGLDKLATAMIEKLFAPTTIQQQPEVIAETRQTILSCSRQGVAAALRGMAARPDMTAELRKIDRPCLIVCGEYDAIAKPAEMREIALALPNSSYAEIDGAGHMAPLEKPDAVNSAIESFLELL